MKRLVLSGSIVVLLVTMGCASAGKQHANKPIRVQGGTSIEGYGLVIDASHDVTLDGLVPGYRVINVAIVNNSFNLVLLNPERDRWEVKTGGRKKHVAITDLRRHDPEVWETIPSPAKKLLTYPLVLPIGARLVVDLFVPEKVPVERLTELVVTVDSLGTTFAVLVRE